MLEPFLINPPKEALKRRRYQGNPLGVEELVVLNPPRPRPKARKRRKTVSMKRKRNAKGRFVKGGVKSATRRRRPAKRRSAVAARRVSAPKRRRRSTARRRTHVSTLRRHSMYLTNPHRRKRYRRNAPLGISMGSIVPTLKEGAFIALGAVAVGQVMARLPYVSTLVGPTRHLGRLAIAILGGQVISKILKQPSLGRAFAMGGVVATALQLAQENFPTLVALSSTDEMGLGLYYAQPRALSEYYAPGQTVGLQPDGLSFEQDVPERLSQNRF